MNKQTATNKVVDKDALVGRDLTPIELEMIERFFSIGDTNFVKNSLMENLDGNIDFLINILQNAKRYRDTSIFRVAPESLDKALKTFGGQLSEEGKRIKGEMKLLEKYDLVPITYAQCPMCGRHMDSKSFPFSDAPQYAAVKHLPFCNECVKRIGVMAYDECKEDLKESIILGCQKLDVLVVKELIEDVIAKAVKDPDYGITGAYLLDYLRRQTMFYNKEAVGRKPRDQRFFRTNFNGSPFKRTPDKIGNPIYDDVVVQTKDKQIIEDEDELSDEPSRKERKRLILKWGDLPVIKLKFLESNYNDWYDRHNISSGKGDELVVKQLCFEEYNIMEARGNQEDTKNLEKNIKNLLSLMKESNLTPKQQAKQEDNSAKTLSEFIKEAEKHGPFILQDPEFKDPDNIMRMRENLAGSLARTLNKPNELTAKFNVNMKEHTVLFDEEDIENESD